MSRVVRLGVGGQMYPPIANAVEQCRRIEAQGWDFIQFPDQLQSTHPQGLLPSADALNEHGAVGAYSEAWYGSFEMMTAAALVTSDIELHLSAIDPLRRSPAVFAQEAATLAHLSGGRARFHIAEGEAKQFEPYGERRTKSGTRMAEAVRIMHALWDSGGVPIQRESEFWPLDQAVFPIPMTQGKPHLYIIQGGPKADSLTSELGEGWSTFLPGGVENEPEALRAAIERIKAGAAERGRDPETLDFYAVVFVVLADSDDRAWELARHPVPAWMTIIAASIASAQTWQKWGFEHPLGSFAWPKDTNVTSHLADAAITMAPSVPNTVTERSLVWGDARRVAERLQGFVDAGLTHLSIYNYAAMADPSTSPTFLPLMSEVALQLRGRGLNHG